MTPEWLHQTLWFVAGVFATGAIWYFLSQRKHHAALWSAFAAATILLLNITLLVRNGLITQEHAETEILHIRLHTAMKLKYPGLIVYVHHSSLGKQLAPVGFAMVLEVTNSQATATRVQSYALDIPVKGKWVRLPSLPGLDPTVFFWVNNGDLRNAREIDFRANSFDLQARDKNLGPGESIKGWMFFEWPSELRDAVPEFSRIRLQVEISSGGRVVAILETDIPQEPGSSFLAGGELVFGPQANVDLSQYPILPLMDLSKQLEERSPP